MSSDPRRYTPPEIIQDAPDLEALDDHIFGMYEGQPEKSWHDQDYGPDGDGPPDDPLEPFEPEDPEEGFSEWIPGWPETHEY